MNAGKAHNLSYQNNIGGLNLSFNYKDYQFGNFDIPHGAILHSEEEHEEHEDEHHEEEEDHEEDLGYLPNSDYGSTATRFGLSKAGDWGYFGISLNNVESLYGIPFHGENHEEHEDEDHEDEHHEDEHHEGERIFSTSKSNVFNLEGAYEFNNSFLQKIDYFYRNSDYSLTEQHAEEEEHEGEDHEDEHHEEGPTLFKNDAREYGAIFYLTDSFLFQELNFLSQKLVLNFVEEDISIIGAEAFMRPTSNEEQSIGYYLGKELGSFHLDFGIRHDQISRNGSLAHTEEEALRVLTDLQKRSSVRLLRLDLHLHTKGSWDCLSDPEHVLRRARELGYGRIAITDHNCLAVALGMAEKYPSEVIPGEEVKTAEGVDIIGLYLSEEIPKGTPAEETIERIRVQGGIAYLPHPYAGGKGGGGRLADFLAPLCDIVEVFNARLHSPAMNQQAEELARVHGKLRAAGSDAHTIGEVGNAYVDLHFHDNNADALLAALGTNCSLGGTEASRLVHLASTWAKVRKRLPGHS